MNRQETYAAGIDENGAHYILSVIFSADKRADLFHKLTTTKSSLVFCEVGKWELLLPRVRVTSVLKLEGAEFI